MKVFFHNDFYQVYTGEPAAEPGRMQAIVEAVEPEADIVECAPATEAEIALAHSETQIQDVKNEALYEISALAAGGAVDAARCALREPAFALVRPPGHHASRDSSWGFCYFNNMAVALCVLKNEGRIQSAFVLDIDLHFGDGTVNILGEKKWVDIHNPFEEERKAYLKNTSEILAATNVDMIGISAGFDNHRQDWGHVLETEDYFTIGSMVKEAAGRSGGGYFAVLEGGYNHRVLGKNALALIQGMS